MDNSNNEDWIEFVHNFYIDEFRKHYEQAYYAYCNNLDMEELEDIEVFLLNDCLGFEQEVINNPEIPQNVLDVYDLYLKHGESSCSISKVKVKECDTYAIRITTDGDDGWLEIFNEQGESLGAARTYLEVISWKEAESLRQKYLDLSEGKAQFFEDEEEIEEMQKYTLWNEDIS